ncbi:MAG: tRNA 2-thiocytidine biosynthesis TtcA family protein [Clostridia bacterium]|nr:tRNA 2-thiocytidine biosynthesis TtcA family protein [Clostridia bacterium]
MYLKAILSRLRRAVHQFDMIRDGDSIAVGVSGGKDSMALLYSMYLFQKFQVFDFKLHAITLSLGFDDFDIRPIREFCHRLGIPYTVKETYIGEIVFNRRKEKNPCSLCAKMRRGALNNTAVELGCNKVALGHHLDDVVETFLLSLFYEGRLNTFSPKTYLDRRNITVIRPMVFCTEKQIIGGVNKHGLPVVKTPCPTSGATKRQFAKDTLKQLSHDIPDIREKIMSAIQNKEQINLWD